MRDLTAKDNIQQITDAIGGGIVQLHYRLPTTTERMEYHKACLVQDGDMVKYDAHQARLDFGLLVMTGFAEGDFAVDGKPFSADPEHENYRADWKERLAETAGDLIEALGLAVFDGAKLLGPTIKKEKASPDGKATEPTGGERPLASNSDD